jgi:dipeptidyl-peptidase-4
MKRMTVVVLILVAFLVAACGAEPTPTARPTEPAPGMPNPASKFCTDQGYQLEIRSEAGGEVGYCLFADGSECEEWAYYNGTCTPGSAEAPAQTAPPVPTGLEQPAERITAGMLTAPHALVGPGPTNLNWSPQGATLAYVEPKAGQDLLWLYEATTGARRVLFDPSGQDDAIDLSSAQWSPQGDAMLLTGEKSIWLLDVESGQARALTEGGKTALAFIPSGQGVSFVQDNDLYTIAIGDGQIKRLTFDGSEAVFNGTLDWVYNEELATRAAQAAYAWSPNGKWLVYLRLDDTQVQSHPVTDYGSVPPTIRYTRYPTAGSPNPTASLHLIDVEAGQQSQAIVLPADAEYILPFLTWTPDSAEALYMTENREHTALELGAWNPTAGTGRTVLRETDAAWINESYYAAPVFLGDGQQFLWLSERDGFMHLYLYTREGELVRQLTKGQWLIDTVAWDLLTPGQPVYVDPSGTWAYFSTTKTSPIERQLVRLKIEGGEMEQLTQEPGFHFAALSGDGQYLVEQFSSVDNPPVTSILKADGSPMAVLGQCAGPSLALPQLSREFLTVKAHDGVDLYAQLVKPAGFDPKRKYGVVVHWYGGPTLQLVSNRYGTTNIFNLIERDVLYTQEGLLVWRLDNRGSFGRGHAFETPIAGQLGPAALDDQLAGIEYLKSLPYVDANRIGSDGKSFGGYMTLYALVHAPGVLRCGVAAAGPTDWRLYDTIYTERYMGTPDQNPEGYAATNLIAGAGEIQVRPLLIHGLADTNVHLENTVGLIEAMMRADKPFDFVPLPGVSHSFRGQTLKTVLSVSADYLAQCLGNR